MPKITFYGATKEVTGSCFLVQGEKSTILVDCGLFQGSRFAEEKNYDQLPFACGMIDNVLVTHAHLDHVGRIPTLCLEGFKGKIFSTEPTLEMVKYLWKDAAEIMDIEYIESGKAPLYSIEQANNAMQFFQGVKYDEVVKFNETDYAIFHDAGHILGSAFIELVMDGKRMIFSGDIGNTEPSIINETANLPSEKIDCLVTEATYGNRFHESPDERRRLLKSVITETVKNNGTLMIPAFAIERSQELLYFLNELVETGSIPSIPIFLDSPLAIEITSVFKKFPSYFNHTDQQNHKNSDGLFNFPGLRLSETRAESKEINRVQGPKVIIAGSGMMNGGRIQFHLQRYLGNARNTLFIVGYQAKNTLGRKILDGAKEIQIMRSTVNVNAKIKAVGAFSAHADQKKLLSWFESGGKIDKIALVHGEDDQMHALKEVVQTKTDSKVLIPEYKNSIDV